MATVVKEMDDRIVTAERLLGTEKRWRRFGAPTPAGQSLKDDGTPDYGLFGPGSVVWEVLLHPSMIFLQTIAQQMLQNTYKPILAGLRDHDPISRKGQAGTMTIFDGFNRAQRNSGIHAPMWLGDTDTARRVAQHLHNIHVKVAGDHIDIGDPELGGYAANSPRDAMWAAITEMHSMLWLYEAFAFRGRTFLPRRLPAELRDRYIAESATYVRLFNPPQEDVPQSMADLKALYTKYAAFFTHSETVDLLPATRENFHKIMVAAMKKNFHRSQWRVLAIMLLQYGLFVVPVLGAVSAPTRRSKGVSRGKALIARLASKIMLPAIWVMQQRPIERYFMRLLWGPDAIVLIDSARKLHRQALKARGGKLA